MRPLPFDSNGGLRKVSLRHIKSYLQIELQVFNAAILQKFSVGNLFTF